MKQINDQKLAMITGGWNPVKKAWGWYSRGQGIRDKLGMYGHFYH